MNNKLDIELLKKDVNIMGALLTKIDTALDRMQDIAANLSKMISLQEQRIEVQETTTKEVQSILEMRRIEYNSEIKELHSRITTVNREVTEKIEKTENAILAEIQSLRAELKTDDKGIGSRLSKIEAWRWAVMGAIVLGTFILTKAIDIMKIFN